MKMEPQRRQSKHHRPPTTTNPTPQRIMGNHIRGGWHGGAGMSGRGLQPETDAARCELCSGAGVRAPLRDSPVTAHYWPDGSQPPIPHKQPSCQSFKHHLPYPGPTTPTPDPSAGCTGLGKTSSQGSLRVCAAELRQVTAPEHKTPVQMAWAHLLDQ